MKINKILTIIGIGIIGVFLFTTLTNSASVFFPYQGGTGTGVVPVSGQLLIGAGSVYTPAYLTAGSNVTISTSSGAITISATGGTGITSLNGLSSSTQTIAIASSSNTYSLSSLVDTHTLTIPNNIGWFTNDSGFITNTVATLSSLTSIGTIGTGAWEGTAIGDTYISSSTEYLVDTNTDIYWTGTSDNLVAATGRTSLELGSMALLPNTGSSTITTVGTIGAGTWNGTAIDFGTYTNATCGTNCTLSNDEISVDDAFLKNDATDVGVGLTLTNDNSATSTAYVPMVLYDTTSTPPAASGFPHGTIYLQYTP